MTGLAEAEGTYLRQAGEVDAALATARATVRLLALLPALGLLAACAVDASGTRAMFATPLGRGCLLAAAILDVARSRLGAPGRGSCPSVVRPDARCGCTSASGSAWPWSSGLPLGPVAGVGVWVLLRWRAASRQRTADNDLAGEIALDIALAAELVAAAGSAGIPTPGCRAHCRRPAGGPRRGVACPGSPSRALGCVTGTRLGRRRSRPDAGRQRRSGTSLRSGCWSPLRSGREPPLAPDCALSQRISGRRVRRAISRERGPPGSSSSCRSVCASFRRSFSWPSCRSSQERFGACWASGGWGQKHLLAQIPA